MKGKANGNVCGLCSIVIVCLLVFLESYSPPWVDVGQLTNLPENRNTGVLRDESCGLFFFFKGLLKLEATLCSVVNTRAKVLVQQGLTDKNTHTKKQFITVALACRRSAPLAAGPKQKADLGGLFAFKFLRPA